MLQPADRSTHGIDLPVQAVGGVGSQAHRDAARETRAATCTGGGERRLRRGRARWAAGARLAGAGAAGLPAEPDLARRWRWREAARCPGPTRLPSPFVCRPPPI